MRIEKFVFGPVGTNCYIVINEMTSECFAVDMADCPQEFVKHIKDAGLCVKALLLTHGHFDHIMGAERFAEIFGCPVYAYEGEENILCDPVLNASATMLGQSYVFTKAEYVKADTQIETAGFQVEIIPTPGHTEGGCCYVACKTVEKYERQVLALPKHSFKGGVHPLHDQHEGKTSTSGLPIREYIPDIWKRQRFRMKRNIILSYKVNK